MIPAQFIGPYAYFEITMDNAAAAAAFGAIGSLASVRRWGFAFDTRTGNTYRLDERNVARLTADQPGLRTLYEENRKLDASGSRKIIEALNAAISEEQAFARSIER